MPRGGRWGRVVPVLATIGLLAAVGIGVSAYLFSSWSTLRTVSPEEAEREFAAASAAAGGGQAYLVISPQGSLRVHRELEGEPVALAKLWVLAWDPARSRLVRTGFPFWFVRAKMTDTVNLGTLTSALAGDWENLGLKISVEELERRGPGIVLDHRLAGGSRLLLWTEKKPADSPRLP